MRPGLALLALLASSAYAQQPAPAQALEREPLDPRKNQKIERIRHEDAGSRIDELRVGGETQQITVTTKSRLPAYEVRPKDGKSLWTVRGF
ncbi:hypothetical protein [Ramlibacter albus]|uniref:DUF2782 domain-containing protein n=1 Tax=Ramlibacter albus TaxID=2079448 RepID=A0A923S3U7_9BURK|nr:hypothetical protein [Ramlibacter albus]MBC5766820.1 hypothetical protein [Ramlibacter albus]